MASIAPGKILPSRAATRPVLTEPFHAAIDAVEQALIEEGLFEDKIEPVINQLKTDTARAVCSFLRSLSKLRENRDRQELYTWLDDQLEAIEGVIKQQMVPDQTMLALITEFRQRADETWVGRHTPSPHTDTQA